MTTEKKSNSEPIKRTTLRLPESLWKQVRIAALKEDMSAQDWVIKALRAHVKGGK